MLINPRVGKGVGGGGAVVGEGVGGGGVVVGVGGDSNAVLMAAPVSVHIRSRNCSWSDPALSPGLAP